MDEKALLILKEYRKSIETNCFSELDILGFLIFIRQYLSRSEFPSIYEFCDLVAHRERDRGRAMNSILAARQNNFAVDPLTNKVIGSEGIDEEEWRNEWERVFLKFHMRFSEKGFREFTLFVISLAQMTEFDYQGQKGRFEALIDSDNYISLCYCLNSSQSLYVVFLQGGKWPLTDDSPRGPIHPPLILERNGFELKIKYDSRYIM